MSTVKTTPSPSPVERRILPGGVAEFRDARGTWRLWFPRNNVVATKFDGHLTLAVTEHVLGWLDERVLARGSLDAYHDWEGMVSYDSAARGRLMRWVIENPKSITGLTLLVRSPLVSMGVAAANAVLQGRMSATSQRSEYERRLAAAGGTS